jgi:hypothetical protein
MQRTMSLKNRRIPIIIISSRFPRRCIFQVYTVEDRRNHRPSTRPVLVCWCALEGSNETFG